MANIQVRFRRGTEAEHDTTNGGFTGAEGEVTVDTTNDTLRVHDGTTAGGIRLAKLSEAGLDSIPNLSALGNVSGTSAVPVAIDIKDEDAMTSNSDTALATQQSIKAYVDSNAGIPTGTVSAFAGNTAPTGYVLCDGSEYSESTESSLFAVIGSTYNTGGETANHFRVPDLRGRVVAGVGGSLLSGTDALGDTGGAKTHTLTEAEMPSHQHSSFKSITSSSNLTASNTPATNYAAGTNADYTMKGSGSDADVGLTGSTGGGQAHNNVQPTIILNYIIKT
jgi:microcystin-dependent protein